MLAPRADQLPALVVDLLGGQVTADSLLRRWKEAGPVPRLVAPVGVYGDGPLELDLVADGPHGLVAGTTGSGKSELLRSPGSRPPSIPSTSTSC